ncbi:receptor-type tyrosine-protein phosphatase C-like isoform X1 [Sebastes umbrosus]|uniref:receptor-type tyrosine-protein phosphatase C-like isoform X1 n=1 Tax=Sebastes umbrosus TaxID=72105 RepID=UPI0018A0E68D|nr:receptor-type tyrosine-protein phosphatase C-like isoform X1 [Sebastes umbrosus]
MAKSPPPPQCSYTVTPIKFGFRIDMIMNSTTGDYTITLNEEDQQSKSIYIFSQSHVIEHLKPCTEYEHSVAFIDGAGKALPCNLENKTMTSGMSEDDIKDVSCMPGYVCYQSEWDISSSLSASNNVPAKPCKTDNKTFCIKPGFDDICTNLTTTFRSDCTASFDVTKSITVGEFLNVSEITQKAPTELPAKIDTKLPPNCKDLTIDYTCQEDDKPSNPKKLSELEPFTDYSCTGQIKENNVTKKNTTAVKFRIDCDIKINPVQSATDTSIELSWITDSQKCPGLHDLEKFSYDCSCDPRSSHQRPIVPANKERSGGRCHIAGLKPFTYYTCKVQPKYDNSDIPQTATVNQKTKVGIPDDIHGLTVTVLDHNVIRVTCDYKGSFNGPVVTQRFIARLHNAGVTKELRNTTCDFSFKDLSYLTEYNVEVTAYNGEHESKPKKKDGVTTSYNDKALIGCLVNFIIIILSVALGVAVYKIYVLRRRKSRNDVMMLEQEAIYANVPRSEDHH